MCDSSGGQGLERCGRRECGWRGAEEAVEEVSEWVREGGEDLSGMGSGIGGLEGGEEGREEGGVGVVDERREVLEDLDGVDDGAEGLEEEDWVWGGRRRGEGET